MPNLNLLQRKGLKEIEKAFGVGGVGLRSCLKMIKQIYYKRKFIAVDFSQRDISIETNGFSQKSRQIMLPYYLAKAGLPQII